MFLSPINPPIGKAVRMPAPVAIPQAWIAPGTCGEFVQGRLDGVDFLINSPIDRYATAWVADTGRPGIALRDADRFAKAEAVIRELEARYDVPGGFEIALISELPQGKGMASSTADLVATIGAVAGRSGLRLSPEEIADILISVEPSDCTHIAGVAQVGHLCGRILSRFPTPLDLRVLVVDCGGEVDTAAFDRAFAHRVYARHETPLRAAVSMARCGLRTGNIERLARASTISARISQEIIPKAPFAELVALTFENGGLGVNCAHSGSVLGLLHRPGAGHRLRAAVEHAFGNHLTIVGDHSFISGGIYVRNYN